MKRFSRSQRLKCLPPKYVLGGGITAPSFRIFNPDGTWFKEGHGVDPDIEVENDPKSVIEGHDPQLERGVAELLKKLAQSTPKLPEHEPFPVKTK